MDTSQYKYVLFINSSVRGPYLPSYWPQSVHWTRVFTDRINDKVKLVGPTISCEGGQLADSYGNLSFVALPLPRFLLELVACICQPTHWTCTFTDRINDHKVKLIGPTIRCEGI